MPAGSLDNSRFHFESSGLPGVRIDPVSVVVLESLSEPYGAELTLQVGDPDADLALLLGSDCVLTIERKDGTMRRLCGIARSVHEGDRPGETAWARVVVVPALWFLGQRRDTRIYQDKTVREILEEVLERALGDYDRAIDFELDRDYPRREYCVQYAETDLDFVHRLMEEEGIFYTFDHSDDREELLLYDTNKSCAQLETVMGDGVVPFRPANMQVTTEPAHVLHRTLRETTTSVVLRDWIWTRSGDMGVGAEKRTQDAAGRDRESYEHGEGRSLTVGGYRGRAYAEEDSISQAASRQEAHAVDALIVRGVSRVIAMRPGTRLSLVDHPALGMDGEYLCTRVWHENRPAEELLSKNEPGSTDNYRNTFECIPVRTPFRPGRRTPKPTIAGVQTAVVTGPGGEEIHVDEHGRIKVMFHWDRLGVGDEETSCWIRVEQAWAGPSWGFWWVPRIGMEVVVQFVDGDPDRPLVTGCVYNGTNATPYELPADKTKSTIKSNSSIGGGGSNEFRYEDLAGREEIYTHAQKDYNEVVLHDHTTLVHHDQTITVDNDQTQEIDRNQSETVHGNQTLTVDANRSVHVLVDFDETVDGTETRTVTGAVTETFDANEDRVIAADVTETIGASETRTIGGNQDETIGGSQSRTISAASTLTILGSQDQTVTGGITSTTPAAHTKIAVGGYKVQTPASINFVAPGGMVIIAPGGVTHVDADDSWAGQIRDSVGLGDFEAFATKIETAGVSIGFTKFKVEVGNTVMAQDQLFFNTIGSKFRNSAVSLMKRLKLDVSAFKEQG